MKVLIKPNEFEKNYNLVKQYEECGTNCDEDNVTCNKYCRGQGTTNDSINGDDILF